MLFHLFVSSLNKPSALHSEVLKTRRSINSLYFNFHLTYYQDINKTGNCTQLCIGYTELRTVYCTTYRVYSKSVYKM